jgi:acetoacetyl-CoA reductase
VAAEVGAVDIVVNNAGITRDGVLHKMTFDDWNEVMRINLGGCFNMAKATFPGMRERGRAASSTSARSTAGRPIWPGELCRRQIGHHGFTKALAQEGAKYGVTVNAIAPAISTPTWWPPCRRRCWKRSSRAFRSAAWARPVKSRAAWLS